MAEQSPTYVRLLNMLSAIRDMSPFNELTADEELLLDDLVVRWHGSEKITVTDLMRETLRVSQSTTYRRLMALKDKGFVDLQIDQNDKRVKFVKPTGLAKEYVKRINQSLGKLTANDKPA